MPLLKPYLSNGQVHSTLLKSNDKAAVNLALNKGLNYRVVICHDKSMSNLYYSLENKKGVVFKTGQINDQNQILDFNVLETGNYLLHLHVKNEAAKSNRNGGCVSVLIGFKDSGLLPND